MPSAPKLSAMCRAGIQPCEKAFGGPPKRPSTTAKDATDHLTGLTNTECRIGLPPGGIFKIPGRQTLFIHHPGFHVTILMQNAGFIQPRISPAHWPFQCGLGRVLIESVLAAD